MFGHKQYLVNTPIHKHSGPTVDQWNWQTTERKCHSSKVGSTCSFNTVLNEAIRVGLHAVLIVLKIFHYYNSMKNKALSSFFRLSGEQKMTLACLQELNAEITMLFSKTRHKLHQSATTFHFLLFISPVLSLSDAVRV